MQVAVIQLLGDLAKLILYGFAIHRAYGFLIHWLDSRSGLPLFTAQKLATKEATIDAARNHGMSIVDNDN